MKRSLLALGLCCSILISLNAQDYSDYTSCALQDSLALVAFYRATDGPNWTSNQDGFGIENLSDDVKIYYETLYPNAGLGKWLEGPVKDWFGVTLEKKQIGNSSDSAWRVIHLHPTLSRRSAGENNLSGYVPKEVGWLTALEWFKVNGNTGLNGSLPDEIYHSTLQEIDVESVFFSGNVSSVIRECTRLNFINLRDNYFDSIPVFDFLDEDVFSEYFTNSGNVRLFFYRNQISWTTLELTVDYLVPLGGVYEARDQRDVGETREIIVEPGSPVKIVCNDAGTKGTSYLWKKNGNSLWTETDSILYIENVTAADTGYYTALIQNEYIRLNDANADYANVTETKPIHVSFIPSSPVRQSVYTSYDGNKIYIDFDKTMAATSDGQKNEFSVSHEGTPVSITGISRTGSKNKTLVLELAESIFKEDSVTIFYTKGSIVDYNGGMLNSFSDVAVTNYTRETPVLINAITRVDGEGIIMEFDQFIDSETLNPEDFFITCLNNTYNIEDVVLVNGDIDNGISSKITLILDDYLWNTDTLYVSYTKGSLTAQYGGVVQSFTDIPVENVVDPDRKPVNISVVDGTGELDEVVIKGDFSSRPIVLNDEGMKGDTTAGDDIWTKTVQVVDGEYDWEVYNRKVEITYDTVITTGPSGEIIYTLTPVETEIDSLISQNTALNLVVSGNTMTGDSIFYYRNNSVVFVLDLSGYITENEGAVIEPYLMGIDDDWTNGISMTELDASRYTATVSGYAVGDVIKYNYRNADIWENSEIAPRLHTVTGNDTLTNEFGVFPTGIEINQAEEVNTPVLYPNPASGKITVLFDDGQIPEAICVMNIYGQVVMITQGTSSYIDISDLQSGIYIVIVTDSSGKKYHNQIIKK